MPLHPQAEAFLAGLQSMGLPPLETLPVEDLRATVERFSMFQLPPEEVVAVVERTVPGPEAEVPIRVYFPAGTGLRPAVMYLHGGGFVTGTLDLVDPVCRVLANRSGCAVVAVDYRLAPEHPYPAAVLDCYVVAAWLAEHGHEIDVDGTRLAIVGDSAGGTLATATCMVAMDKGGGPDISLQVLICPVVDLVKFETPSYEEYGEGHLLTKGIMGRFKELYLTGVEDRVAEHYCSPVRNPHLEGLPQTIVITAECDPLRDEAEAYAKILELNGVWADIRRQDGMIHLFYWLGAAIDRGREIWDEIGADIRKELLG